MGGGYEAEEENEAFYLKKPQFQAAIKGRFDLGNGAIKSGNAPLD